MKTKVVVNMSVEIAHSDGTKVRKRDVKEHLERVLAASDEYGALQHPGMRIGRAVVRTVDID